MDFGFTGIKTFEEYLGRRPTRLLAILIGFAVAAFSMNVIWENLIEPLLAFFSTPLWGKKVSTVIWLGLTIVFGIVVGGQIAAFLSQWRKGKHVDELLAKSKAVLSETEENHERYVAASQETVAMGEAMLAKALQSMGEVGATQRKSVEVVQLLIESSKRTMINNPDLTEAQRAEKIADLEQLEVVLREMGKDDFNDGR